MIPRRKTRTAEKLTTLFFYYLQPQLPSVYIIINLPENWSHSRGIGLCFPFRQVSHSLSFVKGNRRRNIEISQATSNYRPRTLVPCLTFPRLPDPSDIQQCKTSLLKEEPTLCVVVLRSKLVQFPTGLCDPLGPGIEPDRTASHTHTYIHTDGHSHSLPTFRTCGQSDGRLFY